MSKFKYIVPKNNKPEHGNKIKSMVISIMMFNKHGTFYVRASWPRKGLMAIKDNPTIFTPKNEFEAVDKLGIGRVMVTSLRYWMTALGLATEDKNGAGMIVLKPTEIAREILKNDRFFQQIGTAWILHRNLVKTPENATTWYWFFNKFEKTVFTKEDFLNDLKAYITTNGQTVANTSLNRDFNCLKNTYEEERFDDISEYIEEGIISYFSKLNLVKAENKNTYRKLNPKSKLLSAHIIMYSILDDLKHYREYQNQIGIDELFKKEGYVGKVFNLSYSLLMEKLDELERMGYIKIFSRFGHNHIELVKRDKKSILEDYYGKDI
ncbi:MAG: DUF4007 family protein [Natronincolaceae bacterium]